MTTELTPSIEALAGHVITSWQQSQWGNPQWRRAARRAEAEWLDRLAAEVGGYPAACEVVAEVYAHITRLATVK